MSASKREYADERALRVFVTHRTASLLLALADDRPTDALHHARNAAQLLPPHD
jgi:hypothetical protein